jgi:hypothetical protein
MKLRVETVEAASSKKNNCIRIFRFIFCSAAIFHSIAGCVTHFKVPNLIVKRE